MKYTLSIDDYIKLQRYLVKHDAKYSQGFTLRRIFSTSTFAAIFLGIALLSGNSKIAVATLILTLPMWFISRWLVLQSYESKLEKSIKNNRSYTAETELILNEDSLVIFKTGVEIKFPFSVIEDVFIDEQLIYIKAPDGYRIIASCIFSSEAEKEAFIEMCKRRD